MSSSGFGGVETGGTWIVCARGTGPQDLHDRTQFRTASPERTLDEIAAYFNEASQPPRAIGVGAFGPLELDPASPRYGHVGNTPKPGWRHVDLLGGLRRRLPELQIALDTDVNAAALAEQRWGAGRGRDTVLYLTVGTGIGSGLVHGGRAYRGAGHPEAGHIRIPHDRDADPFAGSCPSHGDCWEGLAAGGAIEARTGTAPQDLPPEHPSWELETGYLAAGIHALLSITAPQCLIAGGGVFEHPGLLARVRRRVAELNAGYLPLADLDTLIVEPELGDDAGVLGALALAAALADAP